jgi:hypothetical protein
MDREWVTVLARFWVFLTVFLAEKQPLQGNALSSQAACRGFDSPHPLQHFHGLSSLVRTSLPGFGPRFKSHPSALTFQ